MTVHRCPGPDKLEDGLATWWVLNVRDGDTVHLLGGAVYPVDGFTVSRRNDITLHGHGATIEAKRAPEGKVHRRPFELVNCDRWQVDDLTLKGSRPPEGGWNPDYAAQHAVAVRGCDQVTLCRVTATGCWGDGFYVGDYSRPTTDLVLCAPVVLDTGRHGICSVAARGVLIMNATLALVGRTGFNFEAHEGQTVADWAAHDTTLDRYGIKAITATGEGDVVDVLFDGFRLTNTGAKLTIEVLGPDSGVTDRNYGERSGWTLRDFSGGRDPAGATKYVRFLGVDGLTLDAFPSPFST